MSSFNNDETVSTTTADDRHHQQDDVISIIEVDIDGQTTSPHDVRRSLTDDLSYVLEDDGDDDNNMAQE